MRLIFAGPGIPPGKRCLLSAELLDFCPALIEDTGASKHEDIEALSLIPQLKEATTPRKRPAISSHNEGNHGIRSEKWHYIHYADGSEELYLMSTDPREWHNLASWTGYEAIISDLKKWIPKIDLPPAPSNANSILFLDKTTDEATWEGK